MEGATECIPKYAAFQNKSQCCELAVHPRAWLSEDWGAFLVSSFRVKLASISDLNNLTYRRLERCQLVVMFFTSLTS